MLITRLPLTGIVLAGGRSRRMGRDKAAIAWGKSDLLHTVLEALSPVCRELIVVTNQARDIRLPGVKTVPDNYARCGPLSGMEAGLDRAHSDLCFVAACDMPYVNAASVAYLAGLATGYDAVAPYDRRYHPLYAVYRRTCLAAIRLMLDTRRYRVQELFSQVHTRIVGVDELAVFDPTLAMLRSMNTPKDLLNNFSSQV